MPKVLLAGLLLAGLVVTAEGFPRSLSDETARAALVALLQGDPGGFASARGSWRFRFPSDHGPHPEFRTESWRFAASLSGASGERYGLQLTIVRIGTSPPDQPVGPSSWATREVYWSQLVLSDDQSDRRYEFERLQRGARAMAGATNTPVRVWVGNWAMQVPAKEQAGETFLLTAAEADVAIELSLEPVKPPLTAPPESSTEGPSSALPFHAYLVSRLGVQGVVHLGGRAMKVTGVAWLDRAWGEVPLPIGAVVWDRFLLQLEDRTELMLLRLRRRDGSGDSSISGVLVDAHGHASQLRPGEASIDASSERWRIEVRDRGLKLELSPYTPGAGRSAWLPSWRAVHVIGTAKGQGYVELAQASGPAQGGR